jgi:hypothetical protein
LQRHQQQTVHREHNQTFHQGQLASRKGFGTAFSEQKIPDRVDTGQPFTG